MTEIQKNSHTYCNYRLTWLHLTWFSSCMWCQLVFWFGRLEHSTRLINAKMQSRLKRTINHYHTDMINLNISAFTAQEITKNANTIIHHRCICYWIYNDIQRLTENPLLCLLAGVIYVSSVQNHSNIDTLLPVAKAQYLQKKQSYLLY